MMKKFAKYMPNGAYPNKVGHAFQASISKDNRDRIRFFIEMAPQAGPKPPSGSTESPFDWKQKKFISLGPEEMGRLLACFRGRTRSDEIIHRYPMSAPKAEQKMTRLSIKSSEYNNEINWGVSLAQKVGDERSESYQIFLNVGDVEVLTVFLQKAIALSYEI